MKKQKLIGASVIFDLQREASVEAIVNEAEHIRRVSHNLSAEMKNELQGLKSECVAMAKDLVALNRILEEQKRALIE